jgi:hypothetical protein
VLEWYQHILGSDLPFRKTIYVANYVQFNQLRVGVKLGEIAPFTVDFKGLELTCDKRGHMSEYPEGFFDEMVGQLNILYKGK